MIKRPKPLSFHKLNVFKMKIPYIFLFAVICGLSKAQVNITTGSYTQNFGTANITSWTNNSTFPGWYMNSGNFRGQANLSGSANSFNSGGFYTYNCGGSDAKIGSRASGSSPNNNLAYGLVLRNTTGQTIRSIRVSYKGYQMSLATNGGSMNTIFFDYVVATAAPAITAGGGTGVSALNFNQLQSTSTGGGNQLNWYPCTQSTVLSSCVVVTIPNNSYILLRWKDVDDDDNDHHMAIDDVEVAFDMTGGTCASLLPVELLYFNADYRGEGVDLEWATASEKNNRYFTVERSSNGLDFEDLFEQKGQSKSTEKITYRQKDGEPLNGISYYRLRQTDTDGTIHYSGIQAVEIDRKEAVSVFPNPTETGIIHIPVKEGAVVHISVINMTGQQVLEKELTTEEATIDLGPFGKGMFVMLITHKGKQYSKKIVYP